MSACFSLARRLSDGRFHSGEALAKDLGVTRAAVWKQVSRLQSDYGLEVHAVRGRGYRLGDPLDLLDTAAIRGGLHVAARTQIQHLEVHDSIDSTNAWALRRLQAHPEGGLVCFAEHQAAGRGRHGRTWLSPFGRNLYVSLLHRFDRAPMELSGLSLAIGLAVLRLLRDAGANDAGLKWPNDVLLNNAKLAGILLEMVGEASGPCLVVIGIGINLRMSDSQGESIDQPWTDLARAGYNRDVSRNVMASGLVNHCYDVLQIFSEHGLEPLREEWNQWDLFVGKDVVLTSGARRIEGRYCGIDTNGAVVLEDNGRRKAHLAGELSLRLAK